MQARTTWTMMAPSIGGFGAHTQAECALTLRDWLPKQAGQKESQLLHRREVEFQGFVVKRIWKKRKRILQQQHVKCLVRKMRKKRLKRMSPTEKP